MVNQNLVPWVKSLDQCSFSLVQTLLISCTSQREGGFTSISACANSHLLRTFLISPSMNKIYNLIINKSFYWTEAFLCHFYSWMIRTLADACGARIIQWTLQEIPTIQGNSGAEVTWFGFPCNVDFKWDLLQIDQNVPEIQVFYFPLGKGSLGQWIFTNYNRQVINLAITMDAFWVQSQEGLLAKEKNWESWFPPPLLKQNHTNEGGSLCHQMLIKK